MQRKRAELIPIGDALSGMGGPVKAIRDASPQALHHFTLADQVDRLVAASEADPDRGFMARTMALCSLPRTNPGNRYRYVRRNGPYTLVMSADGLYKLPFGNLPRLPGRAAPGSPPITRSSFRAGPPSTFTIRRVISLTRHRWWI